MYGNIEAVDVVYRVLGKTDIGMNIILFANEMPRTNLCLKGTLFWQCQVILTERTCIYV